MCSASYRHAKYVLSIECGMTWVTQDTIDTIPGALDVGMVHERWLLEPAEVHVFVSS